MATAGLLTMSLQELNRAQLMQRLQERRSTQRQVAAILGISLRQVERLYRAYKAAGAAGLVSKKRGRPGNRKLAESVRLEVVRLVRERYADFGPTLAHEKITELHGAKVGVETLRKWMIADGIWPRASSVVSAPSSHDSDANAEASSCRSTAAITSGSKTARRVACSWCTSMMRPAS
jgi:transposase